MAQTGRPAGRPPAPRPPAPRTRVAPGGPRRGGPQEPHAGLKVAGLILLVSGILSVADAVLGAVLTGVKGDPRSWVIAAVIQLGLGVGLMLGNEKARKTTLWLTALGAVLAAIAAPVLGVLVPALARTMLFFGLGVLLYTAGLFGLLIGSPSRARVALCAIFATIGMGGSFAATYLVSQVVDPGFAKAASEFGTPERRFEDKTLGLAVSLPQGWVMLRKGHGLEGLAPGEDPRLAFVEPDRGAFAALSVQDPAPSVTPEALFDGLLAARRQVTPETKETARDDVTLGSAPARRLSWSEGGSYRGWNVTWADGHRRFLLSLAVPDRPGSEELMKGFVGAWSFDAPLETRLRAAAEGAAAECALLSRPAARLVAQTLPGEAAPAVFFRKGYALAARGLPRMDPLAAQQLGELMPKVFASLPGAQRERLGSYLERVRAGQPTTPADDSAMNQLMNGSIRALAEPDQKRLQQVIQGAIELGRLP